MEKFEPYRFPLSGAQSAEEEEKMRQILFERFYDQFDHRLEKDELVKTPERNALIERANAAIQSYFQRRSIVVPKIPAEIVHFFEPNRPYAEGWNPNYMHLVIADNVRDPARYLHDLIHEMLHAISTTHYEARFDVNDGSSFVHARGPGFGLYKTDDEIELLDITEGMTDLLSDDIMRTTQEEFPNAEEFGSYNQHCRSLRLLMLACARQDGVYLGDMFLTFTKFYIKGDIQGFKNFIQRCLGKETYQMLIDLNGYPEELYNYIRNKFLR